MPRLVVALLLSTGLAHPALADELIRFRTPDGVLGLVDHEDKVPPGAAIVSREPKPVREPRETPGEGEAAALAAHAPDPAEPDGAAEPPAAAEAPFAAALPGAGAAEDEAATIAGWCKQATKLRLSREQAEADAERARERYERCREVDSTCSERELDAADAQLEDAVAEEEAFADACRRAECLPGWIREGCESLP